ncbi:MAG: class I SAM-dependent methyltransferase [Pseudomonadota bacterium]
MSLPDADVFDHPYLKRDICPCCGTPASEAKPAVASTPPAEELPFDRHSRFAAGYDTDRVFFSYYECPRCSLRFCRSFYTQDQLEHLYGHQQENMGEVPLEARRAAQESYAKVLLKHTSGHGGFLEIGPDIGLFAKYCADNWPFNHFWLYEPNREVVDELKAAVAGHEHDVLFTMWPTDDVADGSVSAMALIHVLDHLLEPVEFLDQLWAKLEPGGTILTVTHNCASPLARLLGKRFPPHALQHPQLYSPTSITNAFEKAGFEVLEISAAVNYFPIMHLVRAGFVLLGLPKPLTGAMGPILPIKLGNIATVARKPSVPDLICSPDMPKESAEK